jgi:CxxC-x17-CxxC domain-containing protein
MKKSPKSKSKSPAVTKVDPYLEGFMAKLVERLTGLEQKIDALIAAQTPAKPSQNNHTQAPAAPEKDAGRRDRTLYEAICADCQKVCEVPFKPAEGRAVYCKDCFGRRKANRPSAPAFGPPSFVSQKISKPSKKAEKRR